VPNEKGSKTRVKKAKIVGNYSDWMESLRSPAESTQWGAGGNLYSSGEKHPCWQPVKKKKRPMYLEGVVSQGKGRAWGCLKEGVQKF